MGANDTVTLSDGTVVPLCRPASCSDSDWLSVKEFLLKNPAQAKHMMQSVKGVTDNPMQLEQFREVMALAKQAMWLWFEQ